VILQCQAGGERIPGISDATAAAFKSTFGPLDGPFDASGATDHDTLLQALKSVTVRAEQSFEKTNPIAHRCRLPK